MDSTTLKQLFVAIFPSADDNGWIFMHFAIRWWRSDTEDRRLHPSRRGRKPIDAGLYFTP